MTERGGLNARTGLYEILAALSAAETANKADLTTDPVLRETVFKDPAVRQAYNAVTGLRQTRLDPRDIEPYTQIEDYPKEPSTIDWIADKLGVRKRADGSPPEGEYADPEAALLAGAGDAPPPRVTDAQAALALMRGAGDLPYVLAGAPVDISNLLMSPFGKRTEEMSSDWIKQQATRFGLRPPDETDPTLAGLRMMGEFGASSINPASVPRAAARGAEKVGAAAKDLATSEPARVMLERAMAAGGSGPMYAIRPPGGYFIAGDNNINAYQYRSLGHDMPQGRPSYSDEVDMYLEQVVGGSEIPAVRSFVDKQMRDYLGKTMGSPKDPIRQAIDEGRVPYLNKLDEQNAGLDNFVLPNPMALQRKRRYEGFPEEGYATTEEGKKYENYIDWMIDLRAPSQMELNELPPALRNRALAAIKEQGIENVDDTDTLANIFGEKIVSTPYGASIDPEAATRAALGLGERENLYSFFDQYRVLNLQATKSMLEKMLTDTTLPDAHRLTPDQLSQMSLADASVAVKKLDNYLVKLADKKLLANVNQMPTTKIYDNGQRWLAPDDLSLEHDQRATVRVLGRKGGWCTRDDDHINMYGSGDNRLNILVDKNGRPQVQVTTSMPADVDAVTWFRTLDDQEYTNAVATINRYLEANNIPVPTNKLGNQAAQYLDQLIGLDRIFADDPQYRAFLRENQQPVAWEIERATLEKGASKTALTDDAFNKTLDLVRSRGARFDPNDGKVKALTAVTEDGSTGAPLLQDIGGAISPSVNAEAYALFKDTVLSAPELVQVLRNPQVMQSLPPNIQAQADDLINKFADAPPEAFKYSNDSRDASYSPIFAELVIPVIDAKKYKRWKNSQDPLYQRAMEEERLRRAESGLPPREFAKGGLVERNVYNYQKYL